MKVLSLSDVVISFIFSPAIRTRFQDIELAIGCGDLPYSYQEFVISMLDVPFFFVRGNHDKEIEYTVSGNRRAPSGAVDLHSRVVNYNGLLLAGVEGSLRYREGSFQYSQSQMWLHVIRLIPGLMRNRFSYGRHLDIFVSHAPARGIHDKEDLTHQGIDAFRWLLQVFEPSYHFHGHIHVYRPDTTIETVFGKTRVINTYGYRETILKRFL
jgi:Icc-related predicted phosphoesterase